jgi:uncharacterized membrane protein/Mg-chelatase subunit ChlD
MTKLLDLLGTHWFAVALLVLAAGLATFAARRRTANRGSGVAFPFAVGLALFALGSIFLARWTFDFSDAGKLGFSITRFQVSWVVLALTGFALGIAAMVLLLFRKWSMRLGIGLGCVAAFGLGGWLGRDLGDGVTEVGRAIRYIQFLAPWWLTLLIFVPAVVLVSRRSLSGLGPSRKWVAISLRALGVAALVMALAEPRVRRPSENVTVIFVVDRSLSVPQDPIETSAGNIVDLRWEKIRKLVEDSVKKRGLDRRNDQAGLIFFGKRPKLALPPTAVEWIPVDERMAGTIDGSYTDIAAALKLAMASFPEGNARRVVLISDGNQNLGNAVEQADLARKNGVQIDTVALAPNQRNENEVLVAEVDAPTVSAEGDRRLIRVAIRNEHPTREVDGLLELVRIGRGSDDPQDQPDRQVQVPIDGSNPQVLDDMKLPARVRLLPKINVFRFVDKERGRGQTSYTYKATFTPLQSVERPGAAPVAGLPGDRPANNSASAAVVARGQRRILFLDQAATELRSPHRHLITTLRAARQRVDHLAADKLPPDVSDLGVFLSNYDCLILANVPAEVFSAAQMEMIRSQVHDQGCGLIMVGGPDSFGPGGYQQTPVEAALPVDCEIKAKRAMGKGGLVLIMHASEMADGNMWQKQIAKLAIDRLNPADMVGVVDYGFLGGTVNWQVPFQEIENNKSGLKAKVDRMMPGDMPDFDPFLKAAADTLSDPKHKLATKHVIVISDGDPNYSGPGQAAVKAMADNGITCTTVGVATHGVNEDNKMKLIAGGTKDASGNTGNFYKVTNPNQLPAIYIKESRRVSQSFIYDKPFNPQLRIAGGITDGIKDDLPPLLGFVRTTKKESPLCDMLIEGPQDKEQIFPVLASWRYGLGKAVAFTSDARSQPNGVAGWDREWVGSDVYTKFWEQAVNWAMREAERGKLAMVTEYKDGKVRVRLDAQDEKGKPVVGLSLKGAVTPPGKPAPGDQPPKVEFKPLGNGQYEAEFIAEEAGAYFVNVQATSAELGPDGKPLTIPDPKNPARRILKSANFDAVRAGVTVPYSPEFADLESNTPLLKQLSEITNGNVYKDSDDLAKLAASGDLFRRGPQVIRAVLPFWFWLVFAAAVLLLCDVAIRRISLEWKDLRNFCERQWAKLRATPYEEVESEGLGALLKRKQAVGDVIAKKRATRTFELDPAAEGTSAPEGADDYAARAGTGGPLPSAPPPATAKPTDDDEDGDDFMTRMRKAKERGKKQQGDK